MEISGQIIKEMGYAPASWWKIAIGQAKGREFDQDAARAYLDGFLTPTIPYPAIRERKANV